MWFRSFAIGLALAAVPGVAPASDEASVEHGAYLAAIGGCHDCHSAGFAESGGVVDPAKALTGVPVGFRGPWGTSYPANLRLYMAEIEEDEWVEKARGLRTLPPMPWFAVNMMTEPDLRSLYRYVRSLGAPGDPVPAAVPPDGTPATPVIDFVPRQPTM